MLSARLRRSSTIRMSFIETIDKLLEEMPEEEGADSPDGKGGR